MKPRTYLQALIGSFTSPQYYLRVLNSKLGFSFRFFLLSYVLLAVLAGILFANFDLPLIRTGLHQGLQEIAQRYPASLTVSWDTHTLTSNAPAPIELPYPSNFPKDDTWPNTFATIDTSTTDPQAALAKVPNGSFLLATKDQIFVANGMGLGTVGSNLPLNQLPDFDSAFTVTKNSLPTQLPKWQSDIDDLLGSVSLFYPIILLPVLLITRLLELLVNAAILTFVVTLFRKQRLPFWKMFQIALHIAVPAEFVQIVGSHLARGTPLSAQLPLFDLTFWLFSILILMDLRNVRGVVLQMTPAAKNLNKTSSKEKK